MKRTLSIILILSLLICLLTGCGETGNHGETGNSGEDIKNNESIQNGDNGGNTETPNTNADPADVDFSQADGDMFTDRDARTEYDESNGVLIQLSGTSAAASSNSVKISGTTITITEEATYIISGTLDDGMIIRQCSRFCKAADRVERRGYYQRNICSVVYSGSGQSVYYIGGGDGKHTVKRRYIYRH